MEQGTFSMKKWGLVATDGSLQGRAGTWRACGWAVVQVDYNEEMGLLHGMYGSMESEFEVQRTIKECGADGQLMLSQKSDWTHKCAH